MKNLFQFLSLLLMLTTILNTSCTQTDSRPQLLWSELPSIPDSIGYAGSFAGVANGALLVAGGANFPDGGAPWTGSVKKWYDKVFVLENPQGSWKEAGRLPRPLGYGVSLSWRGGLVCLGGSNEDGHFSDAFLVKYDRGQVSIEDLPSIPRPLANACGVLIGDVVYVAGGTLAPDSKSTESNFWSLDLSGKGKEWQELPSWPGPSRMFSVAGTQGGDFYLFSGTQLEGGKRGYLKDAHKYTPAKGWRRIADLPVAVVAAPATAYTSPEGRLLVFGGDDGDLAPNATQLKDQHPGFSTDILAYDPAADQWRVAGTIPTDKKIDAASNPNGSTWAPVTTPLVIWNGAVVLPGGEVRPATRTPRVLMALP